ncbi:unnamed protein product [Linum trigynum]|uniref:Uncharacterized protein n=1 Tax=Linum trigynum TaxID=586398 RepID=A0AAV2ERX7_9ROSI
MQSQASFSDFVLHPRWSPPVNSANDNWICELLISAIGVVGDRDFISPSSAPSLASSPPRISASASSLAIPSGTATFASASAKIFSSASSNAVETTSFSLAKGPVPAWTAAMAAVEPPTAAFFFLPRWL